MVRLGGLLPQPAAYLPGPGGQHCRPVRQPQQRDAHGPACSGLLAAHWAGTCTCLSSRPSQWLLSDSRAILGMKSGKEEIDLVTLHLPCPYLEPPSNGVLRRWTSGLRCVSSSRCASRARPSLRARRRSDSVHFRTNFWNQLKAHRISRLHIVNIVGTRKQIWNRTRGAQLVFRVR